MVNEPISNQRSEVMARNIWLWQPGSILEHQTGPNMGPQIRKLTTLGDGGQRKHDPLKLVIDS